MDIVALFTSVEINIVVCAVLFSLYSILRKQPSNVNVYFGRRLESHGLLERFIPSSGWILKAWETSDKEILDTGSLDALVFVRILVFSIRVFSIAAVICNVLLLPANYYGKKRVHRIIPLESLDVFTIENVKTGSILLWAHCFALYTITIAACTLLYFEHKSITNLKGLHINGSPPRPSDFTILVRSIPRSADESYSDTVNKFFSYYHASTYLSHQMIFKSENVQKLKELPAAFVFFKSRYAALLASHTLQTSNPMLWVTELAPEPRDVHWSNIGIKYRQIWIRRMGTFAGSTAFMIVFLFPVTFVQGLTQLDKLHKMFPFLTGILKKKYVIQLVTGYLPSVILYIFMRAVPPIMSLLSKVEGSISRSGRKKNTCRKVLLFTVWNVFFVNVLVGSLISHLSVFSSIRDMAGQLAKAVPSQTTFFTTYILSSGWASLGFELVQIFPLLENLFQRFLLRVKDVTLDGISFPYHTEVPRVLLFGFLGFTCSILAPLMLPFLLIYFFLAYLVYRNQILNVYITKYDSGGQYWPIAHNTTVFSLLVAQLIALGVFGIKHSIVAFGFTIPLIIITLLFHQYCKHRFLPVFKSYSAQILVDLDRKDQDSGKMEEIYEQLRSAYIQPTLVSQAAPSPSEQAAPSSSESTSPQDDRHSSEISKDVISVV
ncbi:CSC1-like protein RXW8 [Vicia villosa]|uniref:CSC1-like protein RXW8 n=1 Tax=Vicia villosa TaxID=3911 RepID=UPI00273A965A|nr:CSC1-like protein RXW8 [Vicia villosa]XP_058766095.1 CSC1-like protein RXW8 [Vicia villosa]XP_058766096.1 CSC1-like protein RXW8 [Vicia villosa]XP_058766097.1 CSC1-like protein RXW8 [Vicia villosa]